jgi:hypothetical protein
MACGQSYYEDNPAKEFDREERRRQNNRDAAEKIASSLTAQFGADRVAVAAKPHQRDHDCKRILMSRGQETLTLLHRGYEISVSGDPETSAQYFHEWRKNHMSHARVCKKDH